MPLLTPKVLVLVQLEGATEPEELTVQTDNRDAVQWDITRARKGWPTGPDAPMLWMTFLAWHSLKRTGQLRDIPLDKFIESCLQVKSATPVPTDPTPPGADTGS